MVCYYMDCITLMFYGGGGGAFSRSLSMSEPVKIISQAQLLPVQANVDVKSVKEDDAIVPVHLWKD